MKADRQKCACLPVAIGELPFAANFSSLDYSLGDPAAAPLLARIASPPALCIVHFPRVKCTNLHKPNTAAPARIPYNSHKPHILTKKWVRSAIPQDHHSMILDVARFTTAERPYWQELDAILRRLDDDPGVSMSLAETERFHYLYQRSSSDLSRLSTFSADPDLREYLESLVARAYAEIHETRERHGREFHYFRAFRQWFGGTFPRTFRKHIRAFQLALAITLAGTGFGAAALHFDPASKPVMMPFDHLMESPSERVAREEKSRDDRMSGKKGSFASQLMTHNIRVSLFAFALGITWGLGTVIVVFYNGVILGAVGADYIQAGQTKFLFGWLMPHGAIEIPAILIASQAGFMLAGALIGWGDRTSRRERMGAISNDLLTIAGGASVLLVWAGIVESFFSQYHEPVLPYAIKIAFGSVELFALFFFLMRAGASD